MAERGKPSVAHVYDKNDQCIYCQMFRVNVEAMSHICTYKREAEVDQQRVSQQPQPPQIPEQHHHKTLREKFEDLRGG